jgi:hypothetical protein
VQRAEAENQAECGKHVFDPIAAESPQIEQDDKSSGRRERERRDDQRTHEEWIAGNVEAFAEPEERREHEQAERRFLDVEAFREMRNGQSDDQHDTKLPGATTSARERP